MTALMKIRPYLVACLLALAAPLLIPIYTMNPLLGFVRETTSAGLAAHSFARQGNVDVREYFPKARQDQYLGYALRWRGQSLYSIEPVASSLTFAPFFVSYRNKTPNPWVPGPIWNAVAARVATLTVVLLGVWLLTISTIPRALLVTAIIALATSHRTIVAAGLWQHTSGTLWLTMGLFAWSHARRRHGLFLIAGVALAAATACRPIFIVAPLLMLADAWFLARAPRAVRILTTILVMTMGGLALYANYRYSGSLLGGRSDLVTDPSRFHAVTTYFRFSLLHLAGLLISPNRGLFIFSPILLFALPGLVRSLRRAAPPAIRLISLTGLLTFFLYGFITTWWAGSVFGPRYTSDLLPFFALWLSLVPLPRRGRPVLAVLFLAALVWSMWVQQLGAKTYPCNWNHTPVLIDRAPSRVWDWRDSQIARCAGWSHARAAVRPGVSSP
jgi:hypothetical protein